MNPEIGNSIAIKKAAPVSYWRDYLSLFKPRIVALVVLLALVAAILGYDGLPPLMAMFPLAMAGALASAGASTLNHFFDQKVDRLMKRTQQRPLPSGRLGSQHQVFLLGCGLIALSLTFALALNSMVALYTLGGAFVYVVIYTCWLKRRTRWNIVVGGIAGSCAVLAGWFAIAPQVTLALLGLALLIFIWTPAHFWSFAIIHRNDYQQAKLPMMPVAIGEKKTAGYILIHTLLVVIIALSLYLVAPLGKLYLAGALFLGGLFLGLNLRLYYRPLAKQAWSSYKFSGIYLLLLLLLMAGDILLG